MERTHPAGPQPVSVLLALGAGFALGVPAHAQNPESSVDCASEPIQIAYGQYTEGCAIDNSTDTDVFEFEGVAGELVWIVVDALATNLDPSLRLLDPGGQFVDLGAGTAAPIWCGNGCTLTASVVLPSTGTYRAILTDSGSDEGGTYRFQVERLPPLAVAPPALLHNTPVQDSIQHSTDVDYYAFAAGAGDLVELKIDAISTNLDPELRILDPNGVFLAIGAGGEENLWCGNGCTLTYSWIVQTAGTHTVVVNDAGRDEGGTYSIALQCLFGACPPPPPQNYGLGLAGSGDIVPTLAGTGSSALGGIVTLTVADGLGGAPGIIVLSTGQASIPLFGGEILVFPLLHLQPIVLAPLDGLPGTGSASWDLGIPMTPGLVGASVFLQAGLIDDGAVQGIALTDGLKLTIG